MLRIRNKLQTLTAITCFLCVILGQHFDSSECLPITSKPIESTVENLAWEAWLMVPVSQHQKTRKVTPKSIFIVPQKKNQSLQTSPCPPGEHIFESRCIPTVNIDTEKILLAQLTNLVFTSGDYDYDYEETEPQGSGKDEDRNIVPSSASESMDEPLKFDIFRESFPIGLPGSGDSGSKDSDDENIFFIGERRRRPPELPTETDSLDLDSDASRYGALLNETTGSNAKTPGRDPPLFGSGIDAILLPAVPEKDHKYNFSIYPEMANKSIVNTGIQALESMEEKMDELEKLLRGESLLLGVPASVVKNTPPTKKIETSTEPNIRHITPVDADIIVENKTEFVRSITEQMNSQNTLGASTVDEDGENTASTIIPSEWTTLISSTAELPTTSRSASKAEEQIPAKSDTNKAMKGNLKAVEVNSNPEKVKSALIEKGVAPAEETGPAHSTGLPTEIYPIHKSANSEPFQTYSTPTEKNTSPNEENFSGTVSGLDITPRSSETASANVSPQEVIFNPNTPKGDTYYPPTNPNPIQVNLNPTEMSLNKFEPSLKSTEIKLSSSKVKLNSSETKFNPSEFKLNPTSVKEIVIESESNPATNTMEATSQTTHENMYSKEGISTFLKPNSNQMEGNLHIPESEPNPTETKPAQRDTNSMTTNSKPAIDISDGQETTSNPTQSSTDSIKLSPRVTATNLKPTVGTSQIAGLKESGYTPFTNENLSNGKEENLDSITDFSTTSETDSTAKTVSTSVLLKTTTTTLVNSPDLQKELEIINDFVAGRRKPVERSTTISSEVSSNGLTTPQPIEFVSNSLTNSVQFSSATDSSISDRTVSSAARETQEIGQSTDSSSLHSSRSSGSDPLWWLPTGWRIDRTDTDQPLLMRLWSALSGGNGSQAKV